jgi:hypothetical protein
MWKSPSNTPHSKRTKKSVVWREFYCITNPDPRISSTFSATIYRISLSLLHRNTWHSACNRAGHYSIAWAARLRAPRSDWRPRRFQGRPVRKELEDGTIASHSAKAIIAICWLSHQDSRWRDTVIVSEFTMLRQEPKHLGGREYLQLAHVLKNYDKERSVRKYCSAQQ